MVCSVALAAIGQASAQENPFAFETTEYSFGTISEDTAQVSGHLDYTNRSSKDLIITRVLTSCSCVSAHATDSIVKPGQTSSIEFSFKPLNFPGNIDKQVFIYSSEDDIQSTETIFLTGIVTPTTNPLNEYRYSFGDLYVKQKQVRFGDSGNKQVERINCYNNTDEILSLSVDPTILPQGVTFRTEPEQIPPRTKGELVFSFDPEKAQTEDRISVALPLRGMEGDKENQPNIHIILE